MSIEDILNQLRGLGPVTSTEQTEQTNLTETTTQPSVTQTDSIEKAEEKDAEKGIQAASTPVLQTPEKEQVGRGDPEAFVRLFNDVQASVVNNILDVWMESIEENKKAEKEDIQRAIRLGLDRIGQFAANYASKQEAQLDGVSSTELAVANLTAFTMMSAFTVTQLNGVSNLTAATQLHNMNPAVFGAVPPELASNLAMTGAVVTAGLFSPIFLRLAEAAQTTKGNMPEGILPTQLASATLELVQNGVVNDVIAQNPAFAGLDKSQRQEIVTRVNLSFLLSALTMFYKKETGWVTEEELANLISKGSLYDAIKSENPNDPRLAIVAAIREEMKGLPAGDRDRIMADMLRQESENPSFDSTREMYELLEKMWANLDYERITENPA